MTIKPLFDKVLIKKLEAEEKTAAGLILTAGSKEQPQLAEVIAVGPGEIVDGKTVPMVVKPGDKVYFAKYSGTDIKVDGEEYTILAQKDIFAIAE